MPLTKVTPRKPGFLCSICLLRLPTKDEWSKHLLDCGMADINKRRFECDLCDQAFSKKIVLVRHMKRLHPEREVKGTEKTPVEPSCEKSPLRKADVDEEWQEDPGELLFEEIDVEAGRTYRKKTSPVLPGIKKRKISATITKDLQILEKVAGPGDNVSSVQEAPLDNHHCACCKEKAQRVDAETQTDTVEKEVQAGKSHQKIIRVIRKFQKDGEMVEHLEEDIWND